MREDYGFPPALCRSLAENFLDIMDLYYDGERDPGQVIYNAASSNVPPGRLREDVRTIPVQLTIFDPKDIDIVVEHGAEELINMAKYVIHRNIPSEFIRFTFLSIQILCI